MNLRNSCKRITEFLALAAFLIPFLCSSTRGAASSSALAVTNCKCGITNWIVYSPADHGFSVRFPSQPRILITTNNHTAVGSMVNTQYSMRGHEGREWKFEMIKEQNVIIMRHYLVGHRLYQVHCLMRKDRYCPKHASEFLDSFEL